MNASQLDWFDNARIYYWLQTVLRLVPDLGFWIIRRGDDDFLQWTDLTNVDSLLQPFHFEIYYGQESRRDSYYLDVLRRLEAEPRFTVESLFGFHDVFMPIEADPTRRSVLYVGQFNQGPLDWQELASRWRDLTGQEPASANTDFVRFVRVALRVPVIEADVVPAVEELLALFVRYLSGEPFRNGGPELRALHDRLEVLRRTVFIPRWTNHDWVLQAISSEKFRLTPWYHEGKLADWMREEMRINRLPTTAVAMMPVDSPDQPLDPVRAMVRNHRIQTEVMRFAAEQMPETGANRLQDYGVVLLTSTEPGKSPTRAAAELRERAELLQDHIRERFGVQCVVGIGRTLPEGEPLYESYQEAVLALHLCVQLEKELLVYDEQYEQTERLRYSQLHHAASDLAEAFSRMSMTEVKVASDQYVQLVLQYSNERIEVVRGQFLSILFELLSAVQKRYLLRREVADRLGSELSQRLEEAQSVYQVIEAFKEALNRLSYFSSSSLGGPKTMRLDATLQYLRENFAEPLKLTDVARKAGFSVPAFSRVFKQATGTSFLAYLRAIRIEHAKKLLRTTSLSMEQIAQACGFQSQHHLIRSFKKVTTQTPGAYRAEQKQKR